MLCLFQPLKQINDQNLHSSLALRCIKEQKGQAEQTQSAKTE